MLLLLLLQTVSASTILNKNVVHIAICADGTKNMALLALVNSLASNCEGQSVVLQLHVITFAKYVPKVVSDLKCYTLERDNVKLSIYAVEKHVHLSKFEYKVRDIEGAGHPGLLNPLNFVRFYLDDILPWRQKNFSKILYLDTDCVAQACVKELYVNSLVKTPMPLAAAWRRRPMRQSIDFRHGIWRGMPKDKLRAIQTTISFNAGVLVIDLMKWRAMGIRSDILFWSGVNNESPLYKIGSNPPLVLATVNRTEYFNSSWNFLGLGNKKNLKNLRKGKILHWTGPRKPWMDSRFPEYDEYWKKYVVWRCL